MRVLLYRIAQRNSGEALSVAVDGKCAAVPILEAKAFDTGPYSDI